jgi:hypothetical protein
MSLSIPQGGSTLMKKILSNTFREEYIIQTQNWLVLNQKPPHYSSIIGRWLVVNLQNHHMKNPKLKLGSLKP